ncbi:MAG: twin-arginine translocase subunit TatC [Planctomycetota bacterium]|nr:twin-arginine translocase subunit TatC [Planctomycetota bacterium]
MVENPTDDPEDHLKTMSFGDHLEELRSRVFRSLMIIIGFGIVAFFFQNQLMQLVTGPHRMAMTQIAARQEISDLQQQITEASEQLAAVSDTDARTVLRVTAADEDWWQRWDRFRQSQGNSPILGRMAGLIEERLVALDPTRSSSRILGATPDRFLASIEQLRLGAADLPWGGNSRIEQCIEGLELLADRWSSWSQAPQEAATEDEVEQEQDPQPEVPDPEVIKILEAVARQSVVIEQGTAHLLEWRSRAKPLALLSYSEAFFSYLKLSLMLGLVAALPWVTFEMWKFIAAGLFDKERKAVRPFLPVAFLLMASGVTFAYTVLIPVGLSFLGGYGDPELLQATFTLKEYLNLVFTLILGMGIVFQLPLVMIFLTRSGLMEISTFREYRKYAILGAVLVGAMLTPPDVVTQLLMAGPLVILYELGIIACEMSAPKPREE